MTNERLKTLLYNALVWIDEECADFFTCEVDDIAEWFEDTIGIEADELLAIGCDWLVNEKKEWEDEE